MDSSSETASSSNSGSQPPNTAPSLLDALPTEIVIRVFESLEDLDSALSLACCSKFFAAIFNRHGASIALDILPHDPLVNGTTRSFSFYNQAVDLFVAQQQAALDEDAATVQGSDPATPSLKAGGLPAILTIVRNARIINRTTDALVHHFMPTFENEIRGYNAHASNMLRGVLYDMWVYLQTGEEIVLLPYRPRHPLNRSEEAIMATKAWRFCICLSHNRWRQFGYPNPISILPKWARMMRDFTPELELQRDLVDRCRSDFVSSAAINWMRMRRR
ncbi:hypothetical protein K440DRAFT_608844 [Wilcoxina mikolae CBS 423.85]|nr:hypothetical protein K440DRAFT_608844 [Wilcoxina mikolae CBS 423.85]